MRWVARTWTTLFAASIVVTWLHYFLWAPAAHHTETHLVHHYLFTTVAVIAITVGLTFTGGEEPCEPTSSS